MKVDWLGWYIQWGRFFDAKRKGTLTCICFLKVLFCFSFLFFFFFDFRTPWLILDIHVLYFVHSGTISERRKNLVMDEVPVGG